MRELIDNVPGAAARAKLSAACHRPIAVRSAVVFVDLDEFNVKQMPDDVHVTTKNRLRKWLDPLPPAMSPQTVDAVFAQARQRATWLSISAKG